MDVHTKDLKTAGAVFETGLSHSCLQSITMDTQLITLDNLMGKVMTKLCPSPWMHKVMDTAPLRVVMQATHGTWHMAPPPGSSATPCSSWVIPCWDLSEVLGDWVVRWRSRGSRDGWRYQGPGTTRRYPEFKVKHC